LKPREGKASKWCPGGIKPGGVDIRGAQASQEEKNKENHRHAGGRKRKKVAQRARGLCLLYEKEGRGFLIPADGAYWGGRHFASGDTFDSPAARNHHSIAKTGHTLRRRRGGLPDLLFFRRGTGPMARRGP